MIPVWLHDLAIVSLILGCLCSIIIAADEIRHPQRMWIMNVVWPVTALFGTVWILWQYFVYGRLDEKNTAKKHKPFSIVTANAALHCGSGCTLGDICAEWLVFFFPPIAVWFGWQSIFEHKLFAAWIVDYIFAYLFGIVFQYFTIAPMRHLSPGKGFWAAIKADTLSLTAWQIGMYGFMAFAYFLIFRQWLNAELKVNSVEFWFMMQIAMLCGFATSYPVNRWLLHQGLKEKM